MIFTIYGYCSALLLDGRYEVSAITERGNTLHTIIANSENEGKHLLGMTNELTKHTIGMRVLYKTMSPTNSMVFCVWVKFDQTHVHKGLQKALRRRFADDTRFN